MFLISKNDSVGIVNLGTQYQLSVSRGAIRVNPLGEPVYSEEDCVERFNDIKAALVAGAPGYDCNNAIGAWKKHRTTKKAAPAQAPADK